MGQRLWLLGPWIHFSISNIEHMEQEAHLLILYAVFPLISAEPQISSAPLSIHIEVSASP